jgi:hypothetical protein
MMEMEDFGRHVAQLVRTNKWNDLLTLMHGIGLPAGWTEMIKPMFEDYLGKAVESSIIPAVDIPEHQLVWLRKAPSDIQDRLECAIKLAYEIVHSEDNKERGEIVLPIIYINQKWVLLLVGPAT